MGWTSSPEDAPTVVSGGENNAASPHEHPGRSHSLGIAYTSTKNPAHARAMYCRYNTKEGVSVSRGGGGGYRNTQQTGKKKYRQWKKEEREVFPPPSPVLDERPL